MHADPNILDLDFLHQLLETIGHEQVAQNFELFEALIAEQQGNPQSSFKQFKEFSAGLYHALRLEEDVFDRPLIQIMGASADAAGVQQDSPDLALLAQQLKAHLGPANARRLAQLLD